MSKIMPANRFELLATWYLRFNGYFTAPDFTVHPDTKKQSGGTDADVLAVRFPRSEEFQSRFDFERDPFLVKNDRTDFLICEVKSGLCDINPNSWRDPSRKNVEYAVRWMGIAKDEIHLTSIANSIYAHGECEVDEDRAVVRYLCIGSEENSELKEDFPKVQQIRHEHILDFLRSRFTKRCCGITRENWDHDIIEFANRCGSSSNEELIQWARAKEKGN